MKHNYDITKPIQQTTENQLINTNKYPVVVWGKINVYKPLKSKRWK